MSILGKTLYAYKQIFGHGLNVAYYRDFVRKKILDTEPIANTNSDCVEVHMLTSSGDLLNALWSLKTFYCYSQKDYSLCIHDDGTFEDKDVELFEYHFPDARIIRRNFANTATSEKLQGFPLLSKWRSENPFALKAVDFATFSDCEKIVSLDSDILFFHNPDILIERIDSVKYRLNTLNKDWRYGYSPELEDLQAHVGFDVIPLINSGLGLIHRRSIVYEQLEQYLSIPGITSHPYGGRSEQSLFALSSCQFGFEFLPSDYDVHLRDTPMGISCRHYVSPIRHMMYGEGIKRLVKNGFFKDLNSLNLTN
ncbi:MAG: hypothetical protein HC799_10075 [Limnothrix sp. RL_2_0]|nr:hypothetical protein [Limnothrix sp. RL_2_0]